MSTRSSISGSLGHFSDLSDHPIKQPEVAHKLSDTILVADFPVDDPEPPPIPDRSHELKLLQDTVRAQRAVIDNQKETIKVLMSESVSPEEIASLRAALAAKSALLQLVAAPPVAEQRAAKQLKADNSALRREIDEMEMRHLAEMKQMRVLCASLTARTTPTDGCAHCKRTLRELELENQRLRADLDLMRHADDRH
jgi:hypothetical protein